MLIITKKKFVGLKLRGFEEEQEVADDEEEQERQEQQKISWV